MGRADETDASDQGESTPDLDPQWIARVREALIAWYREVGRELPWRADRDPYRILVSETMLVQTTVAAVVPFFARFLERFPTVEILAKADEGEVLKAWEGLGYYRRARQLHAAAKVIVENHEGIVPSDVDALRALPGVGRYIAGAVASFAFDRPAPVVEANTQRVLTRWLAWKGDLKATATQARLWQAAERLVPETGAGEFNQAFMELGGTLCTVNMPRCIVCPVYQDCLARRLGMQNGLPISSPKPKPLEVREASALVRSEGKILVVKRVEGGLWGGFWEFPTIHLEGANPARRLSTFEDPAIDLASGVRLMTGIIANIGAPAKALSYGVTRHKVRLETFHAEAIGGTLIAGKGTAEAAWVDPEGLSGLTFGAAGRRLFPLFDAKSGAGKNP